MSPVRLGPMPSVIEDVGEGMILFARLFLVIQLS
jgi:hypothetical protein